MCDIINNNKKEIEKERSVRWVLEIDGYSNIITTMHTKKNK